MMRSMFSGVSGLKNMQIAMDVIGNNMANVNTPGYKRSRVVFQDTLYQAMRGGAAPTDDKGGTNPMGIGMGMGVGSVDQIHTGATAESTNNLTDMAIDGNGYFIVKNSTGETSYTRAGAFIFDKRGNLVNSSGDFVQGWQADSQGSIDASVSKVTGINISSYNLMAPQATTAMTITGNLCSTTAGNDVTGTPAFVEASGEPANDTYQTITKEFYDSLGNKGVAYFRFFKVNNSTNPAQAHWDCDVSTDPTFSGAKVAVAAGATAPSPWGGNVLRFQGIQFDNTGKLLGTGRTSMGFIIDRSAVKADPVNITVTLNNLLQYNTASSVQVETQNGLPTGTLQSLSVGKDGTVSGQYDNGHLKALVRVALANFRNPAGLESIGGNLFRTSTNSGDAMVNAPGTGGMGGILPSSLEMSNVDLSEELTNMIIIQRGFTANSRIITTSDEMLQELSNLKR